MDLQLIKEETRPIVTSIKAVVIKTPADMESAVELLSTANKQFKAITAHEDKVIKPLKEALKAKQDEWAPMKKVLKAGIESLRSAISTYQTTALLEAAKKEAKLAERMQSGTLKPETAIAKMNAITTPEAKVVTEAGSVSFRTDKKLKLTDEKLIPREYLVVDENKLLDALKAGLVVPGAEIELVQTVVNRN